MASVDMSLDDIIQERYSSFNIGRGGTRRGQAKRLDSRGRGQNQNNANARTGRGGGMKAPISDARLHIINKNRQKLTDARDKLAEIAKQSDARLKLEKLRERRREAVGGAFSTTKGSSPVGGTRVPHANVSITRRTGRNGQITLTTGRKPVPNVIRRTVANDLQAPPPPPLFGHSMQRNMYSWVSPVNHDLSPSVAENLNMRNTLVSDRAPLRHSSAKPANIKVISHSVSQKHARMHPPGTDWNFDARSRRRDSFPSRIEIIDSDDEAPVATWQRSRGGGGPLVGRMSSELKARLDSPSVVPRTMGILSATSNAAPSAPSGHRIVVSNLQPSVTHEDIRELFEDIGPLLTSRLVRPGTAEVVYENHKDAVKAVDVYHNRQLDGQPMKCMLVTTRPPTSSSSGRGVNSGNSFKLPSGGKSSVVPDVGTIHKALFNKS